jgi:hypothetical protein
VTRFSDSNAAGNEIDARSGAFKPRRAIFQRRRSRETVGYGGGNGTRGNNLHLVPTVGKLSAAIQARLTFILAASERR